MISCLFLLDELEECCRIEHVYYETSFEKIRQYRKSLEEIEELKTKGEKIVYRAQSSSTNYATRSLNIHLN